MKLIGSLLVGLLVILGTAVGTFCMLVIVEGQTPPQVTQLKLPASGRGVTYLHPDVPNEQLFCAGRKGSDVLDCKVVGELRKWLREPPPPPRMK